MRNLIAAIALLLCTITQGYAYDPSSTISPALSGAGTTLSSATAIASSLTVVTTGTGGVRLLPTINTMQSVRNATSVTITVYPPVSTASLDGFGVGVGVPLMAGTTGRWVMTSATAGWRFDGSSFCQVYTVHGTYPIVIFPWSNWVSVELGGGGGAGGPGASSCTTATACSGGGAGSSVNVQRFLNTLASNWSSGNLVVGAGGVSASPGTDSGNGGVTTFGVESGFPGGGGGHGAIGASAASGGTSGFAGAGGQAAGATGGAAGSFGGLAGATTVPGTATAYDQAGVGGGAAVGVAGQQGGGGLSGNGSGAGGAGLAATTQVSLAGAVSGRSPTTAPGTAGAAAGNGGNGNTDMNTMLSSGGGSAGSNNAGNGGIGGNGGTGAGGGGGGAGTGTGGLGGSGGDGFGRICQG